MNFFNSVILSTTVSIIDDIFDKVTTIVTKVGDLFVSLFESAVSIFYNSETGLTIIGVLSLVGIGFSLLMWAFNFIRSLLKLR